jgi:uncharacterized protein YuzE
MIKFDEPSDTLHINFSSGEKGTGIELNDHILLRVNKAQRRAIGIVVRLKNWTEKGLA